MLSDATTKLQVANLTLMALGSSAPEILLSVIEGIMRLGGKPGELGPSTIAGSAAFNLLVKLLWFFALRCSSVSSCHAGSHSC